MSRAVVLVTEPEYRKAPEVFDGAARVQCVVGPSGEADLAAALATSGARHVIIGHLPYRQELYGALSRGAIVARFGVGYENIDLVKATAAGLVCTNTPGVLDQSVAELTMLMMASAARHFTVLTGKMQASQWTSVTGAELFGKTLAIIGSGRIGQAVARIATGGFRMRVIGFRRSATNTIPDAFAAIASDFASAVKDADYVSLHMPATVENRHFINQARLDAMRRDAWLINTARGAVVDEVALYDTLAAKRLAGAALDVFDREPYQPVDSAHDLRMLPNVILTPHSGSNTSEANRGMARRALANVEMGDAGEFEQMDLLNPDVVQLLLAGR